MNIMTKTKNTMVQATALSAATIAAPAPTYRPSILRGRFGSTSVEKQGNSVFAATESLGMVGQAQAKVGSAGIAQALNQDPTPPVYARTAIQRT